MGKYVLKFSKEGYLKYTSHLDMSRLFKRAFKRSEIKLMYSHGFNPHPKMSFAQPLSLGYLSTGEYLEFETTKELEPEYINGKISEMMPEGIKILECKVLSQDIKTLAAITEMAEYIIGMPIPKSEKTINMDGKVEEFLAESTVMVGKRQKKSKEELEINIRPMIIELSCKAVDDNIIMKTKLAAGSTQNLSPELLIKGFLRFCELEIPREEIDILRTKILFVNNLQI